MSRLKVFLSYSSIDQQVAGNYKRHLEYFYGFEVFVAHDDNIPSVEWFPMIKDNLKRSDIFVVLVSKNSKDSDFVNQEIGMALGINLKIFPVKIDRTNPFGFISNIHGFPFKDPSDQILINGSKLFSILISNLEEFRAFGDIAVESTAYALSCSENWIDTNVIISTLLESEKNRNFTKKHIELLISACQNNYEVYGRANSYPRLKKLLEDKYEVSGLR